MQFIPAANDRQKPVPLGFEKKNRKQPVFLVFFRESAAVISKGYQYQSAGLFHADHDFEDSLVAYGINFIVQEVQLPIDEPLLNYPFFTKLIPANLTVDATAC